MKIFFLPYKFWPLLMMTFLTTASIFLIIPELSTLILSHNADSIVAMDASDKARQWYYSAALSFPQIFMMFGAPIFGALSDRFGRKTILVLALVGVAASILLALMGIKMHSISLLLIGLALLGIMDASDTIAQAAAMDNCEERDKPIRIAQLSLASSLGLMMGPLLGGIFSDSTICLRFNYSLPFIMAVIAVFINILTILFFYKEAFIKQKVEGTFDFKFIFQSKKLLQLALIFLLMQIALALFYQSVLLLLQNMHYHSAEEGEYFCFITVSIAFAYAILPTLVKKHIQIKILFFSFFFILFASVLFIFFPSNIITWLAAVPIGVGVGFIYCLATTMMSAEAGSKNQGKIMGALMALVAIGFIMADLIFGVSSSIRYNFLIIGCVSLLGSLFCHLINKNSFAIKRKKLIV